jgi:heme exporter protein A
MLSIMLCVNSFFCERDDRILFEDLNFELREGQVLQIKGSNGSGKTTLLRNICGLNEGYEGAISWYGDPIKECREEFYSSLVYIGHRVGVNKVLTPLENLRWSSSLQQVITDDELLDALEKVGLRGYEDSQCFTLSAGQQQRVSLSKLLLSKAKLWILDEPFTTLDAAGVKQLEALLRTHAGNGGAVMVTTHHTLSAPDLQVLELG